MTNIFFPNESWILKHEFFNGSLYFIFLCNKCLNTNLKTIKDFKGLVPKLILLVCILLTIMFLPILFGFLLIYPVFVSFTLTKSTAMYAVFCSNVHFSSKTHHVSFLLLFLRILITGYSNSPQLPLHLSNHPILAQNLNPVPNIFTYIH